LFSSAPNPIQVANALNSWQNASYNVTLFHPRAQNQQTLHRRSLTEKDSEREGGAKGEERISSGEGVRIGGESKEVREGTCSDDVQGEKKQEEKGGEVEEGRRGSAGSDMYEEEKEEDEVFGWGPSTEDGFLHPIRSSIDQDRLCAESRSFDSEAEASMTRFVTNSARACIRSEPKFTMHPLQTSTMHPLQIHLIWHR
jgi:hypothetical protein